MIRVFDIGQGCRIVRKLDKERYSYHIEVVLGNTKRRIYLDYNNKYHLPFMVYVDEFGVDEKGDLNG